MSDAYFIGAVSRVHGVPRFDDAVYIQRMAEGEDRDCGNRREYFEALAREERVDNEASPHSNSTQGRNGRNGAGSENPVSSRVDMLVTLSHTIYFHRHSGFTAEEWMLAEMESPWAGDERGLVTQRIWSQDGKLLATCVQEGVVRVKGVEARL
jgi:acyl-coenzyme A thioesterase 1/2/4